MIIPIFGARIDAKGKLAIENLEGFRGYMQTLHDQDLELIVRPRDRTRSVNYNRFYWGIVLEVISECLGEEKEDLHKYFKKKFLGWMRATTTGLTNSKFADYIDDIRRWAAQQNIIVPFPNEVLIEGDNLYGYDQSRKQATSGDASQLRNERDDNLVSMPKVRRGR